MKIVDKKTFMDLPVGTIYCHFEPCVLWDLCVKGKNCGADFFYQDILTSFDPGDFHPVEFMKETRTPDFDCEARECLYDDSTLYAVWSKDDVKKLIKRLEETLT